MVSLFLAMMISRPTDGWETQRPGVQAERATATFSCRWSPFSMDSSTPLPNLSITPRDPFTKSPFDA